MLAIPITAGDRRLSLTLLLAAALAACSAPRHDPATHPATAGLAPLHAAGVALPLTIHPIRVLEQPTPRVAEALGLVLEKRGMSDLEVAADTFDVGATTWPELPGRFGAHVREATTGGPKRHHLYAEILGTPTSGPTEVRFTVVDGDGAIVLVDEQKPGDADFRRTAGRDPDPMGCAVLVAERLFHLADWKAQPGAVADGKFARLWRELSGAPATAQQQAMAKRLQSLRSDLKNARIVLLPTRFNATESAASSQRLASLLTQRLSCHVAADTKDTHVAIAADSNEQKVLWNLSRGLGAAVRAHPIDGDYALVVDVGIAATGNGCFVHLAMCDRSGEPVLVEFQNDQYAGLRRAAPKDLEQAEQFAVDWLAQLLR